MPNSYDNGSQQLRDPFVMPDTARAGEWLMYFVAVDSAKAPAMAVGVARSNGDLTHWEADGHPLRSTDSTATHGAFMVESPHVFPHGNHWWLFFTTGAPHGLPDEVPYVPVTFEFIADSLGGDLTDTLATRWTAPDTLFNYQYQQTQDTHLQHWHGSEHLVVGAGT